VRNRRWQVGELFDTLRRLQLWHGPVLFGEPVPSRTGKATRPLTARELHQVRVHARADVLSLSPSPRPVARPPRSPPLNSVTSTSMPAP